MLNENIAFAPHYFANWEGQGIIIVPRTEKTKKEARDKNNAQSKQQLFYGVI